MSTSHNWASEVRNYELDLQGIVNNANYMHYYDQARIEFFNKQGIDWQEYHKQGLNIVLVNTEIKFKDPLQLFDSFTVETTIERESKLKLRFVQKIIRYKDKAVVNEASSIVVCYDVINGKAVMPEELEKSLFN